MLLFPFPKSFPGQPADTQQTKGYNTLELIFGFTVYFLKFSTLALFRELFYNASKATKTVLRGLTYLTILCCVVSITASLYLCFSADRLCDPEMDLPVTAYKNMVNGTFNYVSTLVLDFAIFLVPVWQLFPLRLESRKKIGVLIAFGLGFGSVTSSFQYPRRPSSED